MFLLVDVFEHALGMVEHVVEGFEDDEASFGQALGCVLLLGGGFAAGSAGLAMFERRLRASSSRRWPVARPT